MESDNKLVEALKSLLDQEKQGMQKESESIGRMYAHIPIKVQSVARLTQTDDTQLLSILSLTGNACNLKWHEVLDIMHRFYVYKSMVETKEA